MHMPTAAVELMRRQPKQKRSQLRVQKILESAAIVFLEMGYEAANTHIIAARAQTSVGSLYQFFPDKLALFQALEAKHMAQLTAIFSQILESADLTGSFEVFICHLVEALADYFQHPIPRLIYLQYFQSPELFRLFDQRFHDQMTQQFAAFLQRWNPSLTPEKGLRLARTAHQCYNTLLMDALYSDPCHRQSCYEELKALLIGYLQPHVQPPTLPKHADLKSLIGDSAQSA